MTALLTRINSAQPFTWQAFVWMGLGLIVFSPRILVNSVGYQPDSWRFVLLLTLVILAASTVLLNKTLLRGKSIGEAPWLSWSLMIGLSIFFPIVFRLVSLEIFDLHKLQPGFFRFITAALLWALGTLIFAVIVSETREFKNELDRLRAELLQAQLLEKEERDTLEHLRKKIVREVTQTLKHSFAAMIKNASGKEIALQLQELIDDVVRPLSSKIAQRDPEFSQEKNSRDPDPPRLRVSFREVAYRLAETNPFEYKVTPVIVALSTLSIKTWVVPFSTAFLSVIANVVFLFLMLFLAHAIFARFSAWFNKTVLLIAIVSMYLVISLLDTLISRLVMGVEPSPGNLLITFIELGVMMFLALFRAVPLERKVLIKELDEILSSINWLNSRRGQLIWVEQQRLARLVHGDIQARILAASLDLSLNAKDIRSTQVLIDELQEYCESALSMPARATTLSDFLGSLKLMWAASIDLRTDISAKTFALIDADPVTQDAVIEIIREALNNAVKHSQAHEVTVAAQVIPLDFANSPSSFSLVKVDVVSDVNLKAENIHPRLSKNHKNNVGQGSSIYEQLSTQWTLDVTSDTSRFVAWVPIGGQT